MDQWGVGRAGFDDGLVILFDLHEGDTCHGQVQLYAGPGLSREVPVQRGAPEDLRRGHAAAPPRVRPRRRAARRDGQGRRGRDARARRPAHASSAILNAVLGLLIAPLCSASGSSCGASPAGSATGATRSTSTTRRSTSRAAAQGLTPAAGAVDPRRPGDPPRAHRREPRPRRARADRVPGREVGPARDEHEAGHRDQRRGPRIRRRRRVRRPAAALAAGHGAPPRSGGAVPARPCPIAARRPATSYLDQRLSSIGGHDGYIEPDDILKLGARRRRASTRSSRSTASTRAGSASRPRPRRGAGPGAARSRSSPGSSPSSSAPTCRPTASSSSAWRSSRRDRAARSCRGRCRPGRCPGR